MKHFLVFLVKSYKYILSGFLPDSCHFTPVCSEYTIGALKKHGTVKGGWLAVLRVFSCHPFTKKTGNDPVP